ncbi:Acetyltransferase (GNAT) domain-containing protein [Halobacillus dabanensis]|uniref:Acetyltransferase (GNAT) domain-containing protein n=1 Tax=Halobacillus dabanensis TaxID=240302 RepID=A0A1I3XSQ8_HALDA|nr:GNAT family N-acetyltransferase [Halobacillus dabanensis]SFK22578.1 Acetyltransferase (GNAT) domain-containing protein [Halobacillus dabanensis]
MENIQIRTFHANDMDAIQKLNKKEGWHGLVEREEETLSSWLNSEPAFVALNEGEVIGYLRGLTDGTVTLYICELLVKENYRKRGIAERLVRMAHECYPSTRVEMLASKDSQEYYLHNGFRAFYGFRKSAEEM